MNQMDKVEYSRKSVQNILGRFHHFNKLGESGNYEAVDILVDLKLAVKGCGLTQKQKEIFFYRYLLEYTQVEIEEVVGLSRRAVRDHLDLILEKVYKQINGGVIA